MCAFRLGESRRRPTIPGVRPRLSSPRGGVRLGSVKSTHTRCSRRVRFASTNGNDWRAGNKPFGRDSELPPHGFALLQARRQADAKTCWTSTLVVPAVPMLEPSAAQTAAGIRVETIQSLASTMIAR
jgi:hypothetical protein